MKTRIIIVYFISSFCLFAQQTKFVPLDGIYFQFTGQRVYTADDLDRLWNMAFINDYNYIGDFFLLDGREMVILLI
jgi:hypothetical protein